MAISPIFPHQIPLKIPHHQTPRWQCLAPLITTSWWWTPVLALIQPARRCAPRNGWFTVSPGWYLRCKARDCISAAYVEATCNANCIGMVLGAQEEKHIWRFWWDYISECGGYAIRYVEKKTCSYRLVSIFWSEWDMGVSKNSGTPKIIHVNRVFHYKPSIFGNTLQTSRWSSLELIVASWRWMPPWQHATLMFVGAPICSRWCSWISRWRDVLDGYTQGVDLLCISVYNSKNSMDIQHLVHTCTIPDNKIYTFSSSLVIPNTPRMSPPQKEEKTSNFRSLVSCKGLGTSTVPKK